MFLTLRNDGSNLTIKSVKAEVVNMDSIKLKVVKVYVLRFVFAIPVRPQGTGEAVVTEEDDISLKGERVLPTACKNFLTDKKTPAHFVPDSCLQDRDAILFQI